MTDFERRTYSQMERKDLMAILIAKILELNEIADMLKTEELEMMMSACKTAVALKKETAHD